MSILVAVTILAVAAPSADGIEVDEAPEPKSEVLGIVLPAAATLLPLLIGGALIYRDGGSFPGTLMVGFALGVGPSFGHFYAGEVEYAALISLGRTAALSVGALGVMFGLFQVASDNPSAGWPSFLVGSGLAVVGLALVVRELLDARAAVRRHNEAILIAPTMVIDRAGDPAPAGVLAFRF